MPSWCLFQILRDYHLECKHKLVKGVKTNLNNFNKITPLISLLLYSSFWWGCFLKNTNYTSYKRTSMHVVFCLTLARIFLKSNSIPTTWWQRCENTENENVTTKRLVRLKCPSKEIMHQLNVLTRLGLVPNSIHKRLFDVGKWRRWYWKRLQCWWWQWSGARFNSFKKSSCQVKTYEEALKILWQVVLQKFAW